MAQNILSDVSTCLRDAMDIMFNIDQNNTMPENNIIINNSGLLSAETLKLMINKRKLADNGFINEEQIYQENGNDNTKRLCTTHGYQYQQKT